MQVFFNCLSIKSSLTWYILLNIHKSIDLELFASVLPFLSISFGFWPSQRLLFRGPSQEPGQCWPSLLYFLVLLTFTTWHYYEFLDNSKITSYSRCFRVQENVQRHINGNSFCKGSALIIMAIFKCEFYILFVFFHSSSN